MSAPKLTRGLLATTYEHDVMVMDEPPLAGDPPPPPGCVAIVDAEMDLVAYVPRDKAAALVALLNWAPDAAPYPEDEPR